MLNWIIQLPLRNARPLIIFLVCTEEGTFLLLAHTLCYRHLFNHPPTPNISINMKCIFLPNPPDCYSCVCVCVQYNLMEKRSLRLCVTFLEQIAKQTSGVMLEICAEQRNLNDQVESESVSSVRKLIIQQNNVLTVSLYPKIIMPASVAMYLTGGSEKFE